MVQLSCVAKGPEWGADSLKLISEAEEWLASGYEIWEFQPLKDGPRWFVSSAPLGVILFSLVRQRRKIYLGVSQSMILNPQLEWNKNMETDILSQDEK